jgi:TPR repeat protein
MQTTTHQTGEPDALMLHQEATDAQAQFNLAKLYADGTDVPQDYAKALIWYKRAAEHGLPQAK